MKKNRMKRGTGSPRRGSVFGKSLAVAVLTALLVYVVGGMRFRERACVRSVSVPAAADSLHIGDTLKYEVEVVSGFMYGPSGEPRVSLPSGLQRAGKVKRRMTGIGWGTVFWRYDVPVQAYRFTLTAVPALRVAYAPWWEGEDAKVQVMAKLPLPNMVSRPEEEVKQTPLTLSPFISTETTSPDKRMLIFLLVIVLAGLGAAIFLYVKTVPDVAGGAGEYRATPLEQAEARLSALADDLPLTGEDFYVRLTDILRKYLEEAYAVAATRTTTSEFLRRFEKIHALTDKKRRLLRDIFTEADLVKFGKQDTEQNQLQRSLESAYQFLSDEKGESASDSEYVAGRQESHRQT